MEAIAVRLLCQADWGQPAVYIQVAEGTGSAYFGGGFRDMVRSAGVFESSLLQHTR